jgi:glycerol-3-phosphate acyltransferase PlsY
MDWLFRLFGAPADLGDRRGWALAHPVRACFGGSLMVATALSALVLVGAQRVALAAIFFLVTLAALFALSYLCALVQRRASRTS